MVMKTELHAQSIKRLPQRVRLASLVVALAFSVVTVSAQVNRLDDLDRFGEDAVVVSFGQASTNSLAGAGSEVGQLLGRWGVHFQAAEGNELQISTFTVAVTGPPAFFYEIAHKPLAQEEDGPISVSLVKPAARLGFVLEGHPDQIDLEAYAPDGERLGGVESSGLGEYGSVLGVETSDPRGIALVVLRYGPADPVEKLYVVVVDYLENASDFAVFLPQVGFGSSGGVRLDTQISLLNLALSETSVTLTLIGDDGSRLETAFAPDGQWSFKLRPLGAESVSLAGDSVAPALRAGYARIESSQPVEATAVFTTSVEGLGIPLEAGVASTVPQFRVSGYAEKRVQEGLDTGMAIVNPGSEAVEITLIVDGVGRTSRSLAAGEHVALFLEDIFPQLGDRDFSGAILVECPRTVAATLLRTRAGMAVSSVPAAGLLQQTVQ